MTTHCSDQQLRRLARVGLGAFLIGTGLGHLTFWRREFRAQVPDFVPLDVDDIVVYSGIAEIALGAALAYGGRRQRAIGKLAALFFVAVFPGNVAQYVHSRDGFGLDTDNKRLARLFLQPAFIAWALAASHDQAQSTSHEHAGLD